MRVQILESLADIASEEWNALDLRGNPFVRHEFLLTLEETRCAAPETGWRAQHLLLRAEDGVLMAALPLYLKEHSWGEFVFDWSWATAFAQHGLRYYPKLTSAVPFTPASGPRLLSRAGFAAETQAAISNALVELTRELGLSSAHVLFPMDDEFEALKDARFLMRDDCQFHWRNRNYASFDDFMATFRADKRKKALRERRRVAEAGIRFRVFTGEQMTAARWETAFALSQATFAAHGHEHYLSVEFFKRIAARMPRNVVVIGAFRKDEWVGVAICFRSNETLYGRYWGQAEHYHSLHFETCYFQGIEYCIREGLQRFEPGTQGEHKIARGFEPTLTHSAHFIADARFERVLAAHLAREREAVARYRETMCAHLPFHRTEPPA